MGETTLEKIKNSFLRLFSQYLVFLVFIAVFVIWVVDPELIVTLRPVILFFAPIIILLIGLVFALAKDHVKTKKDEGQGISQYDITISKSVFTVLNLILYGGTAAILVVAYYFSEEGINLTDLIQAIIFFTLVNCIKQSLARRTTQ